jgi:phosphate transport system protein
MSHETRHRFHLALRDVERLTMDTLDLVVQQLDRALEAVSRRDQVLAGLVVADDDRIDDRYLEVHETILSLLATQAPVAGELRTVAALLHVIRCVERMGDQCVDIAKLVPLSGNESPHDPSVLEAIEEMGVIVRSQVVMARQAFGGRDEGLVEAVAREDAEVDRLNRLVFERAVQIGEDADLREWATFMVLVARALERIGDNSVDIGEQVVFVVSGVFRELGGA